MHRASAIALVIATVVAGVAAATQAPIRHTFDLEKPGAPPVGFTLAMMRQPTPGDWLIRRVGVEALLVHHADPRHGGGFSMAVASGESPVDMVASVRMRLASGARAGGLVWRYQDPLNYHTAILDLARHQLALFRVSQGNLVRLESEDDLELDVNAWHVLKVEADENDIRVSLGGLRAFQERSRTVAGRAGHAGLIATGASEVWFDDFRVEQDRKRR